jgi:hypothetical protein
MRGSGAGIGLVAFSIAGLVLLALKIFRIKHSYNLEEMAGLVVAVMAGSVGVGALIYCLGIALGILPPLNRL